MFLLKLLQVGMGASDHFLGTSNFPEVLVPLITNFNI